MRFARDSLAVFASALSRAVAITVIVASCSQSTATRDARARGASSEPPDVSSRVRPTRLEEVRYWAYQIQDLSEPGRVEALADERYDMLVVEPTRTDWSHPTTKAFDTRGMVARLKASPASDPLRTKLVLAYVDVGQAETWRWYWTWSKQPPASDGGSAASWPSFVVGADPDGWSDCWVVAYWSPEWRRILLGEGVDDTRSSNAPYASILDEVVSDGFDGIYMDWIEAYDDERAIARARSERRDAAEEMVRLIADIRRYAAARTPGFLVVQQNSAALLENRADLLEVIDGIAQENTWYGGEADLGWEAPRGHDLPQTASVTTETLDDLDRFRKAGKPVFTVDYTVDHADEIHSRARTRGYVPYCTRSSLSRPTTTPPFETSR